MVKKFFGLVFYNNKLYNPGMKNMIDKEDMNEKKSIWNCNCK